MPASSVTLRRGPRLPELRALPGAGSPQDAAHRTLADAIRSAVVGLELVAHLDVLTPGRPKTISIDGKGGEWLGTVAATLLVGGRVRLQLSVREHGDSADFCDVVAVAGGLDRAALLNAGERLGCRVTAYFARADLPRDPLRLTVGRPPNAG